MDILVSFQVRNKGMPPRTSLLYLLTPFSAPASLSLCRLSMQKAEIFIVVVVYGKGTKPELLSSAAFFCDLMIAMLSIRRGGEGCGGGDDDDGTLMLSFLFADRSVRLIS